MRRKPRGMPSVMEKPDVKLCWIRNYIDRELGGRSRHKAGLYGATGAVVFAVRTIRRLRRELRKAGGL